MPAGLRVFLPPQVTSTEVLLAARCKRVFANAHTYHINSISVNSDQATFLSADDLRVNLWNLEITEQSFNIVDIKPANMEDLTEVSLRQRRWVKGGVVPQLGRLVHGCCEWALRAGEQSPDRSTVPPASR